MAVDESEEVGIGEVVGVIEEAETKERRRAERRVDRYHHQSTVNNVISVIDRSQIDLDALVYSILVDVPQKTNFAEFLNVMERLNHANWCMIKSATNLEDLAL